VGAPVGTEGKEVEAPPSGGLLLTDEVSVGAEVVAVREGGEVGTPGVVVTPASWSPSLAKVREHFLTT